MLTPTQPLALFCCRAIAGVKCPLAPSLAGHKVISQKKNPASMWWQPVRTWPQISYCRARYDWCILSSHIPPKSQTERGGRGTEVGVCVCRGGSVGDRFKCSKRVRCECVHRESVSEREESCAGADCLLSNCSKM